MSKRMLHPEIVIGLAMLLAAAPAGVCAAQLNSGTVRVGANDLGGMVSSASGPEAGVWVIAEATDLPTKFVKIVVTDDMGRYLVPELPKANYNVWVRGYGLVDSPKVQATPGKSLNLKAVLAPDKRAAAEYYPALYWFSMLQVPPKSDFPGTGPSGNGISSSIRSQGELWISETPDSPTPTLHASQQIANGASTPHDCRRGLAGKTQRLRNRTYYSRGANRQFSFNIASGGAPLIAMV